MNFLDLAIKRESCRRYSPKPVEREKLEAMVEAARLAPSAVNSQPWFVHVVTDPVLLPKVVAATQIGGANLFVKQAKALLIVTEEGESLLSKAVNRHKERDFTSVDIGIFAAHLVLCAASMDLGTCILGWFSEKKIQAALGLDKSTKVRLAIAVGYPKSPDLRRKVRKPAEKMSRFY
ncbi:MAG TPA: NAD(P)H nitroreductase [Acholeplasmatales bacterium]|nr:NAD(P)H nitroreductase [Acholeplasmatales bacterium]